MATPSNWFYHSLVLLGATIGYSHLATFGFVPPNWLDRIAVWLGLGYLYWAWDGGLQASWPACRTRTVLRCLLLTLVASSPIAVVLAACKLRNYVQSDPAERDRSSYAVDDCDEMLLTNRIVDWGDLNEAEIRWDEGVNPATGLPLVGNMDIQGNPYGSRIHE